MFKNIKTKYAIYLYQGFDREAVSRWISDKEFIIQMDTAFDRIAEQMLTNYFNNVRTDHSNQEG